MTIIATMRRAAILGSVALAAVGLCGPAFAQKTKLTVYTAIENEQLDPFKKAFEANNPTIEIAWVRDSTGVMTAKLIGKHPRAYFELTTAGAAEAPRVNFTPPAATAPGATKR